MTNLHIRAATARDVQMWRDLRHAGICAHPGAFIVTPTEAAAIPIEVDAKRLALGGKFLAFVGDRVVGLSGINRNPVPRAKHRAEIGPFYVVQAARGQGAADGLMTAMVAHARALDIWQIELYVNVENARAIAFYSRHRFVETGRVPNAILGANGPETDALMIRTLDQQDGRTTRLP